MDTRRSMNRLLAAGAGFLAIGLVAVAEAATLAGSSAPDITVRTLAGAPLDLAALRGKVVVVHWWASWCVPCREEMPELEAFYGEHRDQGVEVIALSADRARDEKDVRRAAAAFSFPVAIAASASVNHWPAPGALPMTYIVDQGGKVRDVLVPGRARLTRAWLNERVLPLLAETPSARN